MSKYKQINQTEMDSKAARFLKKEKIAIHYKSSKLIKKESFKGRRKNMGIGEFTVIKDVTPHKKIRVERVLPHWLLNPITVRKNLDEISEPLKDTCPLLDSRLVKMLKHNGINQLFPVQKMVIPQILANSNRVENRFRPRDICIATPTGSGKTLSFVLPIVQVLCGHTVPAIRALVILPVLELARQVNDVFIEYASVFNLKVGHAYGKEPFNVEQNNFVQRVYKHYQSKVDILVCTPGRLMRHIMHTPGLDFSQLRFLVLDEADRLLAGEDGELIGRIQRHLMQFKSSMIYSPCLPPCLRSLRSKQNSSGLSCKVSKESDKSDPSLGNISKGKGVVLSPFLQSLEQESLNFEATEGNSAKTEYPSFDFSPPLQRLLFSATLTHDPEQLQNVTLYRPQLFSSDYASSKEKHNTPSVEQRLAEPLERPSGLVEMWVKTDPELKFLTAHYLLRKEAKRCKHFKALVFTNSIELTSKVAHLLRAMSKQRYSVEEFSSKFDRRRKTIIKRFSKGVTNVLVSSDAMARGIDVPNIDYVMSFDVPSTSMYIHRIGRTARAGKLGKAISFVTDEEFKDFKKNVGSNFENITEVQVKKEKLIKFQLSFQSALASLSLTLKSYGSKGRTIRKTLKRKKNAFAHKKN